MHAVNTILRSVNFNGTLLPATTNSQGPFYSSTFKMEEKKILRTCDRNAILSDSSWKNGKPWVKSAVFIRRILFLCLVWNHLSLRKRLHKW